MDWVNRIRKNFSLIFLRDDNLTKLIFGFEKKASLRFFLLKLRVKNFHNKLNYKVSVDTNLITSVKDQHILY